MNALSDLIADEAHRVGGVSRVLVAGFSQGGALAYWLGLTQRSSRLAGVLALSTFLPRSRAAGIQEAVSKNDDVKGTPVLICHGSNDERVPGGIPAVQATQKTLQAMGLEVRLEIFEGLDHSATQLELEVVLQWMKQQLSTHLPTASNL